MGCLGGSGEVSGSDQVLQNEYAQIGRDQFEDYKVRYGPIQDELISDSMNPQIISDSADRAKSRVDMAFSTAQLSTNRELSRRGVTLTGAQQQVRERINLGAKLNAQVAEQTNARIGSSDRQDAVRGQVIGLGQGLKQEALGNYQAAAAEENQRGINNANQRQKDKANTVGALTSLATLALL